MKRQRLTGKHLRVVGYGLMIGGLLGGIVLGDRFRIPSYHADGTAYMMFDMGLMFSVALAGLLLGLLLLGKGLGRK